MNPSSISSADRSELLRAGVFHTPGNPFRDANALVTHTDGGLLIRHGKVVSCGDFAELHAANPDAAVTDWRGGFVIPGMIDTHVHFPQVRVIGSLGYELLDWLEHSALPEEARMSDARYAAQTAKLFVNSLASHGTTTALVFGSHFAPATACLFSAAANAGLRLISGLVLSDRNLRSDLHQTPEQAYRDSAALIKQFHDQPGLSYAVTPRFALSTSEAMLEVCQTLLKENPGLGFQTHLNENTSEITEVRKLFPSARNYLDVYAHFGLLSERSVLAHNVHPEPEELACLASLHASVAHCPSSNAALASGIFPMTKHIRTGVRFALGTDVGAGTGFSLMKESLQAYLMQRIAAGGMPLTAAHLLFLATRAGAEALGLDAEIGDFQSGKAADFVYLRPQPATPLAAIAEQADSAVRILSALFTLSDKECIQEVRVAGTQVYRRSLSE